jgi:hypothetical protein
VSMERSFVHRLKTFVGSVSPDSRQAIQQPLAMLRPKFRVCESRHAAYIF